MRENHKFYKVAELMGGISYSQIGEMLKVLVNDTILGNDGKYRLIASDFGIDIDETGVLLFR